MGDVKPEQVATTGGEQPQSLQIKIKSQDGDSIEFKVKRTTKFEKIFKVYCDKKSYELNQVRFLFDGDLIQGHQTVGEVQLEDGDTLDCMIQQVGGSGGI